MALAVKLYKLSSQSLLKNKGCLYNVARYASEHTPLPWNYIWEPGEYSKKDHDKIAEKYHMHPKDYKPMSEDKMMGDYPDLPLEGPACRDPYYPYDIPTFKKNYHEVVHYQFEMMTEDRSDLGKKHRIDIGLGSLIHLAVMAGLAILYYALEPYPVFEPVMEKQYPYDGKIHYTFELEKK